MAYSCRAFVSAAQGPRAMTTRSVWTALGLTCMSLAVAALWGFSRPQAAPTEAARTLKWEALLPEGWDPDKLLKERGVDQLP